MTDTPDARQAFLDALVHVAPEVDPDDIDPSEPLRDQLEIDSMDFLNLMIRLNEVLGVEGVELRIVTLRDLDAAAAYLSAALAADAS